jgi:hemerythrin-like metal-binding protein
MAERSAPMSTTTSATSQPEKKVEWTDALSVGIDVIDEDHKALIDIINRVLEAEREGTSVKWALGELAAYANYHFTREEKMMEAANYPDLAAHKKTHKAFIEWLQSLRTVYGADPGAEYYLAETMREYLQTWLTDHIMKVDADYKGKLN